MNCTEFEEHLNANIGNTPLVDCPDLREHAVDCACCSDLWDGFQLLENGLPLWKKNRPEIDLAEQIVSQIDWSEVVSRYKQNGSEISPSVSLLPWHPGRKSVSQHRSGQRQPSSRSGGQFVLAVAVSAMLFIACLLWLAPVVEETVPQVVATPLVINNAASKPSDSDPQSEISGFVREAGDAYLMLAEHAVVAFSDASIFIPDAQEIVFPSDGDEHLNDEENPGSFDRLIKDIEVDWQPIRQDVQKAFDIIIRSMPEHNPAMIL